MAAALAAFEGDFLYTAQNQSLFLHTPLFFRQHMVRSGGMLAWAASYLTQFFCYPLLGATLLALLWCLLLWLLVKTFRLRHPSLALVPVACLLLTVTTLGYWVFYLKLHGPLFSATLGTLMAVFTAWIYSHLPRRYFLQTAFIPLAGCVAYPLFGFYGLWGVLLTALVAWTQGGSQRLVNGLAAFATIGAVPLIGYYTLYHQTNIINVYWTALPLFSYTHQRFPAYYIPYIILVVSISLMAFPLPSKPWLRYSLLAMTAVAVVLFWQKDANFHRELSMRRSIEKQDWDAVLATAKDFKGQPTRAVCLMRNLALQRKGWLGKQVLQYPDGARRPDAPFSTRLVHTYGKMLYLELGLPNYCYRWSMEDGVEYGWTVERLKLMTLCSLLSGEFTAAQRFLNLLKKTDFHPSWARHYEQCLHKHALIAADGRLKPILPLLRSDNFLTADQSQEEMFLIEHLLSTPGTTLEQQELANFTMFYYRHNRRNYVEK
jgi:hypothetical protein